MTLIGGGITADEPSKRVTVLLLHGCAGLATCACLHMEAVRHYHTISSKADYAMRAITYNVSMASQHIPMASDMVESLANVTKMS